MTDLAAALLINAINACDRSSLWFVDETMTASDIASVRPRDTLMAVTNRFDLARAIEQHGINVRLSDFDISDLERGTFHDVFYRVSKEKAQVHYILNKLSQWLEPGQSVYLSGYKGDGIKTYAQKATTCIGEIVQQSKGGKTSSLLMLQRNDTAHALLDDKDYESLRLIHDDAFYSKPGIFGWQKVDQGSRFLIDALPALIHSLDSPPQWIADIGCGYGYISVMANALVDAHFIATDNNAAAVIACKKNFEKYQVSGDVLLDDCGQSIQQPCDLVLCNPPFHQGFDINGDLTARFLKSCHHLLRAGGSALFVVNAFIPLEKKARQLFSDVQVVDNNRRFKLIHLLKR